jgi:chromosome segregation ATPase
LTSEIAKEHRAMVTDEQFQEYRAEVKDGFKQLDNKIEVLFEQHEEQHAAEAEQIKTILSKLDRLETDMREVKDDVGILKTDMRNVKEDVSVLKTDMRNVKEDVSVLKTDMRNVKEDVRYLKEDMRNVKEDVRYLKEDMRNVKDRLK